MPETIAATQIEQDWEEIIDSIDAEKCVIFLGSGIYQMPEEQNIDQALGRWLDLDNPDHPSIQLHNDDGFFLFRSERRHKRKVIEQIKSFYNQPFPETSACFTQLAQIPFHIIMSVMPDNILSRTFDDLGFPYQADLYFRKRPHPQNFEQPSRNKPLIYNLLGNIEEPESLVLTHSDFFDYMESVFIAKSMHPTLKEELELAERYIFLGLPYEKWYFQFLLRVLSLHSDKLRDVERMAVKEFQNPKLQKLYTEEFKINFITTHPELFIKDLHQACADAGVLKKLPTPDPQLANLPDLSPYELKELLAKAEMESAFQHLKVFLERRKPRSHSLANDLVVLRNQYNLLNKREIMGTIDSRDLNVEQNQMIERLTNLIDQAGELG